MLKRVAGYLGLSKPQYRRAQPMPPALLITEACMEALRISLESEMRKRHEGIAYLLGLTNGSVTLATSAFRPTAKTSRGSFEVDTKEMAKCVRAAARHRLQVVAQVHTHPGPAYHSDGDVEGARIRYPGYTSIVLPDYGNRLPSLDGAAVYLFSRARQWIDLKVSTVIIVPGILP